MVIYYTDVLQRCKEDVLQRCKEEAFEEKSWSGCECRLPLASSAGGEEETWRGWKTNEVRVHTRKFPENLIVNYGEVNRQSDYPTVKQESHPPTVKNTPHEPTGKSRDRVGSSGCLHPEQDISPPQCPQLSRRGRAYYPRGKNVLLKDHRGRDVFIRYKSIRRSWLCSEAATKCY